jgi:hypothetical protein
MVEAPKELQKSLNISQKGSVTCVLGTAAGEGGLDQLPFHLCGQIDSYYYEDRPAGTLLIGRSERRLLEDSIYSKKEKLLCPVVAPYPRFAWVEPPYIADDGMLYINSSQTDPLYLAALLNSAPIFFWFVFGAKKFQRGLLKIDEKALLGTPLAKCDPKLGGLLAKLSNEASNLKKARRGYLDLWKNYSAYMKNGHIRLRDLLAEGGTPKSDDALKSWGLISPSDLPQKSPDKKFDYLISKAYADQETYCLRISGVRKSSAEAIMDFRFASAELMLYVYCALNDPYSPRPKTPEELMETMVPVILPDHSKLTLEIEKAVMWDFRNYVSAEKLKPHDFRAFEGGPISVPKELLLIDRQLEETLAKIDFGVFSIYGFSNEGARTIMEALPTFLPHKEAVMKILSEANLESDVTKILEQRSAHEHAGPVCHSDSDSEADDCQHSSDKKC